VFDHPTIASLADFLGGGESPRPAAAPDALLEEMETLSDDEAERLLKEELERS